MKQTWLERLREMVADRGRDLLANNVRGRDVWSLCRELLSEDHGEASGIALSREIMRDYQARSSEGRRAFFETLAADFGPDREGLARLVARYLEPGPATTSWPSTPPWSPGARSCCGV